MQRQTTTYLNTRARRARELQAERVVSVLCVSILLSMSLAGVVAYGLARALLATAPTTFRELAP